MRPLAAKRHSSRLLLLCLIVVAADFPLVWSLGRTSLRGTPLYPNNEHDCRLSALERAACCGSERSSSSSVTKGHRLSDDESGTVLMCVTQSLVNVLRRKIRFPDICCQLDMFHDVWGLCARKRRYENESPSSLEDDDYY